MLRLTKHLASGLKGLEPERASRHINFILSFQQPDGGFAGRKGGSDLYYTSFAVRALMLMNALDVSRCQTIAAYLKSAASKQEYGLIDLVSWFYSVITVQFAGNLEPMAGDAESFADELTTSLEVFRRPDGGYAKNTTKAAWAAPITPFSQCFVMKWSGERFPIRRGSISFCFRGDATMADSSKSRR